MEIVREIELEADPRGRLGGADRRAQLEEWFANDVELDPTPGGRACSAGTTARPREAVVESVEEGERIVLRFDDDGVVDLRVVGDATAAALVQVRESAPSWSTALELHALAACAIR